MSYGSDVTCIFARNRSHWSKIHQTQLTASEKCILVSNRPGRNRTGSGLADPSPCATTRNQLSRQRVAATSACCCRQSSANIFGAAEPPWLFPSHGCTPRYGARNALQPAGHPPIFCIFRQSVPPRSLFFFFTVKCLDIQ